MDSCQCKRVHGQLAASKSWGARESVEGWRRRCPNRGRDGSFTAVFSCQFLVLSELPSTRRTAVDPGTGGKRIFLNCGRFGRSSFLSRKAAAGLHWSHFERSSPVVNETWSGRSHRMWRDCRLRGFGGRVELRDGCSRGDGRLHSIIGIERQERELFWAGAR